MSSRPARSGRYALATGADAVGRLSLLHRIYAPVGREVLIEAGISEGMRVPTSDAVRA